MSFQTFYPVLSHAPNNSAKHMAVTQGFLTKNVENIIHDILYYDPSYFDELTHFLHGKKDFDKVQSKIFFHLLDQEHPKVVGSANEAEAIGTMCKSKNPALLNYFSTASLSKREEYLNRFPQLLQTTYEEKLQQSHNHYESIFNKNFVAPIHDTFSENSYSDSNYDSGDNSSDEYLHSDSGSNSEYLSSESENEEEYFTEKQAHCSKKTTQKRSLHRR